MDKEQVTTSLSEAGAPSMLVQCKLSTLFHFSIGIVLTSDTDTGTVGNRITFSCSSDLDPLRIEWYRENTLLSRTNTTSSTITLGLISTDDEGAVYTCNAVGRHGSQERNKTLNVKGTIM